MGAAWSEIQFVVPHGFISQKLEKLQKAESLPLCQTDAAFFLKQCSLYSRAQTSKIERNACSKGLIFNLLLCLKCCYELKWSYLLYNLGRGRPKRMSPI